ncbi:MAG: GNAT family N-acetyltransferase [Vibrio hibernica]
MITLTTERLILRPWKETDLDSLIKLNQDPEVMRFFPSVLSEHETQEMFNRVTSLFDINGWGFWLAEHKDTHEFIGLIGLNKVELDIPYAPFMEVGWRVAKDHWGKEYAPEGARAAIKFAFDELDQAAVYAFTAKQNAPSQRVMQKIGMVNTRNDFDHPKLEAGDILQRHCLYKISR